MVFFEVFFVFTDKILVCARANLKLCCNSVLQQRTSPFVTFLDKETNLPLRFAPWERRSFLYRLNETATKKDNLYGLLGVVEKVQV